MNTTTTNATNEARVAMMSISTVSRATMEASRGRNGVCATCGKKHEKYVKIEGCVGFADSTKARYIGFDCFLPIGYGSGEDGEEWYDRHEDVYRRISQNMDGTDNTTKHRLPHVSVEFEIVSQKYGRGRQAVISSFGFDYPEVPWEEKMRRGIIDYPFVSVYVRLLFLGYQKEKKSANIEDDCTVTAEGHCRFRSLQGLSRFLNHCTEEELQCFRDVRCGAHIHASCDYARASWCGTRLFNPTFHAIQALGAEERIKRFGSDFRGYASESIGGHGCSINFRTAHNTIEFRLSRIHDNEQFITCCKWWRGTIAIINEYGALIEADEISIDKVACKMARQLSLWHTKYAKGN